MANTLILSISRTYEIVIEPTTIGSMPAVAIRVEHTDAAGNVSPRGGFRVAARMIPAFAELLMRAYGQMEEAIETDRQWSTRRDQ